MGQEILVLKFINSIKNVGDSPTVSVRQRDGATWHR